LVLAEFDLKSLHAGSYTLQALVRDFGTQHSAFATEPVCCGMNRCVAQPLKLVPVAIHFGLPTDQSADEQKKIGFLLALKNNYDDYIESGRAATNFGIFT